MNTVKSKDGPSIALDKHGDGPALIVVDGAMGTRSDGSKPELARLLRRTSRSIDMTAGPWG